MRVPTALTGWNYHPPLVVTDARVGGVPVSVSRFNGGNATDPLTVTPEANSLRVEFSALDYSAPERNLYAYRLKGFDKSWIDTEPTNRLAANTNLPPGDYSLELRGSNRDGAWSPKGLAVPIRVLPAWYQTLWFQLAEVLAGLVAVALLVQGRTAYLRRHERELERQVAERTAELHQRTVELKESQLQLEHFAFFDALTGLPNRRMFTEDFRKFLAHARRAGGRFALLLIDLDGFKHINDALGHDAGDALLIEAGARLRAIALASPGSAATNSSFCLPKVIRRPASTPFAGESSRVSLSPLHTRVQTSRRPAASGSPNARIMARHKTACINLRISRCMTPSEPAGILGAGITLSSRSDPNSSQRLARNGAIAVAFRAFVRE